jgi:N-dimethylarginine dimethylaminohydrolase
VHPSLQTPPEASASPQSEFDAAPSAIIVHDPVAAGAFDSLRHAGDAGTVKRELLFDEMPEPLAFGAQHRAFVGLLRQHAKVVCYLSDLLAEKDFPGPVSTSPNQIYTRDPLITIPWLPQSYIVGRMRMPIRQTETRPLEAACQRLGLRELIRIPEGLYMEGGDVIPFVREGRRALLVGFGPRTSPESVYALQDQLIPEWVDEIIGIELASWRLNLDGGMVPIASDVLITHRASIRRSFILDNHSELAVDAISMFQDLGFRIVDVDFNESRYMQACNCLCLGRRRIVCYGFAKRVLDILEHMDIHALPIAGSELVKGTGGPRCMSRPIYQSSVVDQPAV